MAKRRLTFPHFESTTSFIGLEKLMNELDEFTSTKVVNFPRHNIVNDDNNYTIELAVAGYPEDCLDVKVSDKKLIISGESVKERTGKYLHKGITTKRFVKEFKLTDKMEVDSATLVDGILSIEMHVVISDEEKLKNIKVNANKKTRGSASVKVTDN